MTPFQRLGLPEDADERAIKRAYARQLRQCRPDEDALAFQALQEDYRACLAQAEAWRVHAGEEAAQAPTAQAQAAVEPGAVQPAAEAGQARERGVVEGGAAAAAVARDAALAAALEDEERTEAAAASACSAHSNAETTDAALAATQAQGGTDAALAGEAAEPDADADDRAAAFDEGRDFDGDRFLGELLHYAHHDTPAALAQWLQDQPALYSLQLKQALRAPLAQVLADLEPPLPPAALRAVFAFFALDQVEAQESWLSERTAHAQRRADNAVEFERALQAYGQQTATDDLLLRELTQARRWPRRLFAMLVPGLPGRIAAMIAELREIDPERAQQRLDAESLAYWSQVADHRRISPQRACLALLRVLAYPLLLLPMALLDGKPISMHGLSQLWLSAGGGWLALALGKMLRIRWHEQRAAAPQHWHQDIPLRMAAALALLGLAAAGPAPGLALASAIALLLTWWLARGYYDHTLPVALCAAGLAASADIAVQRLTGVWLSSLSDTRGALYALAGAAAPMLQDLVRARWHGIDLRQARSRPPPTWPWVVAAGLAVATVAFALP